MDGSSLLFRQNVKERPREKQAATSGPSGESDKEKTSGRKMKPSCRNFWADFISTSRFKRFTEISIYFTTFLKKCLIKSAVALNKCFASMWCWCTVSFFHSSSSRKVKTEDWNVYNLTS